MNSKTSKQLKTLAKSLPQCKVFRTMCISGNSKKLLDTPGFQHPETQETLKKSGRLWFYGNLKVLVYLDHYKELKHAYKIAKDAGVVSYCDNIHAAIAAIEAQETPAVSSELKQEINSPQITNHDETQITDDVAVDAGTV